MKVEKIDFETVLVEATKLPMVKINRENFLRKEFQGRYKNEVVEMAIQHCPAYTGIKVEEINEIVSKNFDERHDLSYCKEGGNSTWSKNDKRNLF